VQQLQTLDVSHQGNQRPFAARVGQSAPAYPAPAPHVPDDAKRRFDGLLAQRMADTIVSHGGMRHGSCQHRIRVGGDSRL